jgi:hypothetical protein
MLMEYGHFLNHVLHDKANKSAGDSKKADRAFAFMFAEYSEADLFSADFAFADFTAPDSKGGEQKFTLEISGLDFKERRRIFHDLGSEKIWEGEV